MTTRKYLLFILILILISTEGVYSQSLSVNKTNLNEYYRRQQLLGNIDSSISFAQRPISSEALQMDNIYDPNRNLEQFRKSNFDGIYHFHKNRGKFQLLPFSILTQYNSHHPEGINDGSMIPARGTQVRADLGMYFKYSLLSINLNPEFVYAHNRLFDGYPAGYKTDFGILFPDSKGTIDLPERIGGFHYTKAFWGQSSIRLTYKTISIGLSNENLWWGPGYKNALLMTNSAPGFLHLTLNTVKPIKTVLGSFEGQIIGGKIEESGYTERLPDDWRYLNAMIISYQPKWIPGLFLGLTRSFLVYSEDIGSGIGSYMPVFSFLSKSSNGSNSDVDSQKQDQRISLFMRWLFAKSNGELYVEYGREDHSWDTRDLFIEPSHTGAYTFGIRKLMAIKDNRYFQVIGEITHLASNQITLNRRRDYSRPADGIWYHHKQIKHGYTNQGQMLGSGIDPASNTQMLQASWNKDIKQVGVEFERYVHNNNFWFEYIEDFRANWVDLSTSIFANWDYKHFLLYGKVKFVRSKNYQWLYEPSWGDVQEDYWTHTDDIFNFHMQAGITYRF